MQVGFTAYFDPGIHQALKARAAATKHSVSELVDEAVRLLMIEDLEDLQAFSLRKNEAEISYEDLLVMLRRSNSASPSGY